MLQLIYIQVFTVINFKGKKSEKRYRMKTNYYYFQFLGIHEL